MRGPPGFLSHRSCPMDSVLADNCPIFRRSRQQHLPRPNWRRCQCLPPRPLRRRRNSGPLRLWRLSGWKWGFLGLPGCQCRPQGWYRPESGPAVQLLQWLPAGIPPPETESTGSGRSLRLGPGWAHMIFFRVSLPGCFRLWRCRRLPPTQ